MADKDWSEGAIFDAPLTRRPLEEIRIEQPPGLEAVPAVLPPTNDSLRAALEDPQLAEELWRRVDGLQLPVEETGADDPLSKLAISLYLLQMIHSQDKPGQEHLPRRAREAGEDDEPHIR